MDFLLHTHTRYVLVSEDLEHGICERVISVESSNRGIVRRTMIRLSVARLGSRTRRGSMREREREREKEREKGRKEERKADKCFVHLTLH